LHWAVCPTGFTRLQRIFGLPNDERIVKRLANQSVRSSVHVQTVINGTISARSYCGSNKYKALSQKNTIHTYARGNGHNVGDLNLILKRDYLHTQVFH
jgi:hypothetical protein